MEISNLHKLLDNFIIRYLSDRPCAAKSYFYGKVTLTVKSKLTLHGLHDEQKWIFDFILNKNNARIAYFEAFIPGGMGQQQSLKKVQQFLQNKLKLAIFKELINYAKEK